MVLSPSSFSSRLCVGSLVGLVSVRKELRSGAVLLGHGVRRRWVVWVPAAEAVGGVGSSGGVGFLGFCIQPLSFVGLVARGGERWFGLQIRSAVVWLLLSGL
ncbi:Uncharacterized protein Rs2_34411 [Raphanus sativus]|nr:Uncharacterized protein Rs2_34411 [Raphanus sativus]